MKKIILLLAAAILVFCGCSRQPNKTATTVPSTVQTEAPTEAPGVYQPDSTLEKLTGGAVKCYLPEGKDFYGIAPMGDGLLLFGGSNETVLTMLTGKNLTFVTSIRLDCRIEPTAPHVRINSSGMGYYDASSRVIVFLDNDLQESSRIQLPEDMDGSPALSADLRTVYYCVGNQIRVLDIQSGISRLLKQHNCVSQTISGILCNDTVLRCAAELSDGSCKDVFISTENGQTLYTGDGLEQLSTYQDSYFASLRRGSMQELIFGINQDEVLSLEPPEHNIQTAPVLALGGVITMDRTGSSYILNYYDLNSGLRTASLELSDVKSVTDPVFDPSRNTLWFLISNGETDDQILCSWEISGSSITDHTIYAGMRYTAQSPDLEGLRSLETEAARIGEEYDVEILLWQDAVDIQPNTYRFESEYMVRAYEQSLIQLENALSRFPDGFLEETAEQSDCGVIRIALVRAIYGDQLSGTLDQNAGTQYWYDGNACIALVLGENLEQNLYHQLFHVIETRVYASTVTYDDWNKLNPSKFKYDYDYVANQNRDGSQYLEGSDRAFIDTFSMSFPKEDRARIMEYAMMAAGEEYFTSSTMQKKLKQLCTGIRKAYGLQKHPEILPWEQHLEKPLTP